LFLRWPSLRKRLATLDDPTGDFESLCAAYEEACDALDRWRQSEAGNAELRVGEYTELVKDLELDLMRFVSDKLR
jgi:hypothetical protein